MDSAATISDGELVFKLWYRPETGSSYVICVEEYTNHGRELANRYRLSIEGAVKLVDALLSKVAEARGTEKP